VRTDAQSFSTLVNIGESFYGNEETFAPLFKYCTELRALDLGHHQIANISGIANLTKLQTLILADNKIVDISPLAELKDLNYVELFFNKITDVSPLTKLENLEDLNLCYNPGITNATELTKCKKLNRLYISNCRLSYNEISTLKNGLPENCEFNSWVQNAVYQGWRTNTKNAAIRKAFSNWQNVKEYPDWEHVIYK
jgi:Leucine-rich repeat (LRR) protein